MNELPISKQDAVAFFRFQIISEMLDAPKGYIRATAKSREKAVNSFCPTPPDLTR